jgi:hypothetical protein
MFSWEKPDDRVAIVNMNSELRHAQLELLSAECATHQLRLRFSVEDLARFGQRDVLRKSVRAATALSKYYKSIEEKIGASEPALTAPQPQLTEEHINGFAERVASYLREQREQFMPSALPLKMHQKALMWPYFSGETLERVKMAELDTARIPNPPFYEEARAFGFVNLPEVTHMPGLTLIDVLVFHEGPTVRSLFHALVHAVQFELLGLERYCHMFVRSFAKTKLYFSVPLEVHAFSLESKFLGSPEQRFSVEEQVGLWIKQNRY